MSIHKSLALIIFSCIFCLGAIGICSFFLSPADSSIVSHIVDSLSGIVLMVAGAKAGLSLPSNETEKGTTNVVTAISTDANSPA